MNLFGLRPEEFQKLLLSVGSHLKERALTPIEVGLLFKRMLGNGATAEHCAKAVHFDGSSMVHRFLKLLTLAPTIQHNVDWGSSGATIGFSAAAELARLDTVDQESLAQAAMENEMSSAEVKQAVQLRKRAKKDVASCVQEVLGMRPEIIRRHVFVGAITSEVLRQRLTTYDQRERDALFTTQLANYLSGPTMLGAKLGTAHFTIVTNDAGSATLRRLSPDFETALNASLEGAVTR
jgi:hypothetical protein